MPYVVFQISVVVVVHNGLGDDDHDEAMVMKIIHFLFFCCKSHIHRLKQKEEGESSGCSFKGDRDAVWSTFVVDPRARHGIACHCCFQDSSIFSASLALEMDPDDSFILS
jgi:hypothetical protein